MKVVVTGGAGVKLGAFRQGDVHSTWADIRKAKEQLGYYPAVTFSEGLTNTIKWAKKHETEIC
ncbi:hypothetical protein ACIFOT_16045 [Neobacillus sp. NRS-1170]|uniref:hypothetical protein n=1 Tax=Neobacillus sp. NRS-1170 TaxID=3233898 RepID=UPI003D29412B